MSVRKLFTWRFSVVALYFEYLSKCLSWDFEGISTWFVTLNMCCLLYSDYQHIRDALRCIKTTWRVKLLCNVTHNLLPKHFWETDDLDLTRKASMKTCFWNNPIRFYSFFILLLRKLCKHEKKSSLLLISCYTLKNTELKTAQGLGI